MINTFSLRGKSLFFSVLSAACALLITHGTAHAQAVEGCNPAVLDAMQKTSQGRVANSVANDEAIFGKPDNPLAMSCFNKAAGNSASKGGAIFSGDFIEELRPVIEEGLTNFYDDYDDAEGNDTGTVDYAATALSNADVTCDGIQKVWENFEGAGIKQGIPVALFSDLVSGTIPAGAVDPDFVDAWNAARDAQTIFSDISVAIGNLPAVTAIPAPPAPDASLCQTLLAYNIGTGPCP